MIKSALVVGLSLLVAGVTPTAIAAQPPMSSTRANETQISQNEPSEVNLDNLEQTIAPEKWALIQQLVELTQSSQLLDQMLNSLFGGNSDSVFEQMTIQSPHYQSATAEEQQEMLAQSRRMQTRMYQLMVEEVDLVEITRNIEIYLYNKYYNEEDLTNLLAFYQTPTGRKLLDTMPQMAQDSVELSSRLVVPRMMNVLQKLMEELGETIAN